MSSNSRTNDSQTPKGEDQSKNSGGKGSSDVKKDSSRSAPQSNTSGRGFASMDPKEQREIAAEGGRAAHASGKAHEFTSDEAREAGSKSRGNSTGNSDNKQGGSGTASRSGSDKESDSSTAGKGGNNPSGNRSK